LLKGEVVRTLIKINPTAHGGQGLQRPDDT
jgi:hypothetical protein